MKLFLHSYNGKLNYVTGKGDIATTTLNDLPTAESYYLLSTSENLKLLPYLLQEQLKINPGIKTYLGNANKLNYVRDHDVLSQLVVMPPTLASPYTWVHVDDKVLQTVKLANSNHENKDYFLTPYLNFVGLHLTDPVRQLLSLILDPRWFAKPGGKTSLLTHYLGLDKMSGPRSIRKRVVERVYDSRVNNLLSDSKAPLKYTVHYIAKTWLQCLDSSFKFKPDVFFKDKIVREKYYATFGE